MGMKVRGYGGMLSILGGKGKSNHPPQSWEGLEGGVLSEKKKRKIRLYIFNTNSIKSNRKFSLRKFNLRFLIDHFSICMCMWIFQSYLYNCRGLTRRDRFKGCEEHETVDFPCCVSIGLMSGWVLD